MDAVKTDEHKLDLAFELISDLKDDNFQYVYRGLINSDVLGNILTIAENSLIKAEDTKRLKKRIYYVIVEVLQNITRHQKHNEDGGINESGMFMLQKKNNCYSVTTANVIEDTDVEKLANYLDKINQMDEEAIKKYFAETLINGSISARGGAGLGFIAMFRRTGTKLKYEFGETSNGTTFFYLRNELYLEGATEEDMLHEKDDWQNTITLHKILAENNILLNFNGQFDTDNMVNLLKILEKQIVNTQSTKDKIMRIMLEMLKNIVKYADGYDHIHQDEEIGNPGIFYIRNVNNKYHLIAGNFIRTSFVEALKNKLEFSNRLNNEKLLDFYKNLSDFFAKNEITKPDLSILEMRILSKQQLHFQFRPINDSFSFFTLQTNI